jgi:hypothetical protein
MADRAGKVQWFEPFEIRRRKGVLEIAVRMVQGTIALLFPIQIVFAVAGCVRVVRGGHLLALPYHPIVFLVIWISLLLAFMVRVASRRFVFS